MEGRLRKWYDNPRLPRKKKKRLRIEINNLRDIFGYQTIPNMNKEGWFDLWWRSKGILKRSWF